MFAYLWRLIRNHRDEIYFFCFKLNFCHLEPYFEKFECRKFFRPHYLNFKAAQIKKVADITNLKVIIVFTTTYFTKLLWVPFYNIKSIILSWFCISKGTKGFNQKKNFIYSIRAHRSIWWARLWAWQLLASHWYSLLCWALVSLLLRFVKLTQISK